MNDAPEQAVEDDGKNVYGKRLRGWADMIERKAFDIDDVPYLIKALRAAADRLTELEPK
jgi:hypothetical protein